MHDNLDKSKYQTATFAAGCFWGVELSFSALKGVIETTVGYTGGHIENPSYEAVCRGNSGHAEAVKVIFDPDIIDYEALVNYFFNIHDPTQLNQQGPDIGHQYRSAIFVHSEHQALIAISLLQDEADKHELPITTEIIEASTFYPAEEYHQKYLAKRKSGS